MVVFLIKSQRQKNIGVAPLRKNDVLVYDPQETVEILNNQFSSVSSLGTFPHPQMHDSEVTLGGIQK